MKNTNSNEKETQYFLASLSDLKRRHEDSGKVFFTSFLSESEVSEAVAFLKNKCEFSLWGGYGDAVRKITAFGEVAPEDFPIVCLEITVQSFSEPFSHRDVLGSLMSLGTDRSVFGDIVLVNERKAYVFCLAKFETFVCENLTHIAGEGSKVCAVSPSDIKIPPHQYEELRVSVSSPRLDCYVSALANCSREKAKALISEDRVFFNGICVKNPEKKIDDGSVLTVRGVGKFIVDGYDKTSRKGKLQYRIRKFI